MAYADGSDLISRYDVRLIADLITDTGETLPPEEVAEHPNVETALKDASGEIVVALITGGRYIESDLTDMSNPASENYSENSANHLKRVCCDIAMNLLVKRRPIVDEDRAAGIAKQSREHLKRLADGENVFGIQAVVDAGQLDLAAPSTINIQSLNLLPERMGRYFPGTGQRMPKGR